MLGTIASMLPVSAKVRAALATLDINKQESNALDEVVSIFGKNPVVATLVGSPVTTLTEAISAFTDTDITIPEAVGQKVGALLDLPEMRVNLAKVIMGQIASSERRETLLSVLEKVSHAPIQGFGDVEHVSAEHFIAEGLLPYLTQYLPGQDAQEPVMVHKCPFCHEVFCE